MRRFLLISGVVMAVLALAAVWTMGWLSTDPALPPLPQIAPRSFAPGVREQVEEALAAARADPNDPVAVGNLGMVLHAYEQFSSAAATYERARALEPDRFRWRYYQGRVLVRAARTEEGFELLQEAMPLRPGYAPLWIELGDRLLAEGNPAGALHHYRSAIRLDPGSAIGHYGLGQALQAEGRIEEAADEYGRALALAPRFGAAHYALGLASRDLGQPEQALKHFNLHQIHQLTLAPARDPLMAAVAALEKGPSSHSTRGVELARAGRADEAIAELLEALELDPNHLPAHANLIQLYANQGRFDEAEHHFRVATANGTPAPTARLHYARALINQRRPLEAAPVLEELLEINPYSAEAHVLLGSIRDDQGRWEEALRHYRAALESAPNYPQANLGMVSHLLRAGDLTEAEKHARKAQRIAGSSIGLVQYRLAVAYSQAGHREQAVAYLQTARQSAHAAGQQRLIEEVDRALGGLGSRVDEP